MRIAQFMKQPVITVKPGDTPRHARELLERNRINQLPVVLDERVVGIVTDRDLRDVFPSVLEDWKQASDPSIVPIADIMSANVLTLGPDAAVADAARLMRHERIGAIPIVDHGRLIGILTRSDVLAAFAAVGAEPRAL